MHRQVGCPFLSPDVRAHLVDERGNDLFVRQIHPVDVPHLAFAGYEATAGARLILAPTGRWRAGSNSGWVPRERH